jgi:hypothetical protein
MTQQTDNISLLSLAGTTSLSRGVLMTIVGYRAALDLYKIETHTEKPLPILGAGRRDAHGALAIDHIVALDEARHGLGAHGVLGPEEIQNCRAVELLAAR